MIIGCWYLYSNIQVYITSYLNKQHPTVSLNQTFLGWMLNSTAQSGTIWIGALLIQRINPKIVVLIGTGITLTAVFASSFVTRPLPFWLLFGLFNGIGCGLAFLTPLVCGWEYFPKRKGLVTALALSGLAVGPFIFGYISLAIANPENKVPELEVDGGLIFYPFEKQSDRAPQLIRIIGSLWTCLAVIAVILISKPEKPNNSDNENGLNEEHALNRRDFQSDQITVTNSNFIPKTNTQYISLKQALWTPEVWNLTLIATISMIHGFYVSQIYKSYGELHIKDDAFLTTIGTFSNLLCFIGRIFWPIIQDIFGFKPLYMIILVTQITTGLTLSVVISYKTLYFIWIGSQYLCIGGYLSLTPTVWAYMYGHDTGGKVYSIIILTFTFANLTDYSLQRGVYPLIGYENIFYIVSGWSWISLILLLLFKEKEFVVRTDDYKESGISYSKLNQKI